MRWRHRPSLFGRRARCWRRAGRREPQPLRRGRGRLARLQLAARQSPVCGRQVRRLGPRARRHVHARPDRRPGTSRRRRSARSVAPAPVPPTSSAPLPRVPRAPQATRTSVGHHVARRLPRVGSDPRGRRVSFAARPPASRLAAPPAWLRRCTAWVRSTRTGPGVGWPCTRRTGRAPPWPRPTPRRVTSSSGSACPATRTASSARS